MASDQGLSIFDEPESADDTAAPGGSTARGNAGEETQVLPVTPKDDRGSGKTRCGPSRPSRAAPPPSRLPAAARRRPRRRSRGRGDPALTGGPPGRAASRGAHPGDHSPPRGAPRRLRQGSGRPARPPAPQREVRPGDQPRQQRGAGHRARVRARAAAPGGLREHQPDLRRPRRSRHLHAQDGRGRGRPTCAPPPGARPTRSATRPSATPTASAPTPPARPTTCASSSSRSSTRRARG